MKLIAITTETIQANEAVAINHLFGAGLETLHLRKPSATRQELRLLLEGIHTAYHQRIVLHDHFDLTADFPLKGIHLNRRNPEPPSSGGLSISKSCHTLEELHEAASFDYLFLSPIFNSISKSGYGKAFTDEELYTACDNGWINRNVYALGGIDTDNISQAARYGFGGVVVLGALWGDFEQSQDMCKLLERLNRLQERCSKYERMNKLLFITHQTDKYNHLQSAELALQGGCRQIQLRMKDTPVAEVELVAAKVKKLCDTYGAQFFIDDHVEVCLRVGATGVHLGKLDMPPSEARQILGDRFLIGGTANTFDDIRHLHDEGVNYIGLGPFRFTTTKKNLSPILGLEGYREILTQCRQHNINLPILAIGGITIQDIPEVMRTGVSGIALSSTILQAADPVAETQQIIKQINTYPL